MYRPVTREPCTCPRLSYNMKRPAIREGALYTAQFGLHHVQACRQGVLYGPQFELRHVETHHQGVLYMSVV